MPGSATPGFSDTEYRTLLQDFPPRPIRTAAQVAAVQARIDALLDRPELSPTEEEYLSLLGDLVWHWEEEHVSIPPVGGVSVVRFLLEQQSLPQQALVPIFGTKSIVSEVLAGRRTLQAKHIQALAAFFHVEPGAFFPVSHPPRRESVGGQLKG